MRKILNKISLLIAVMFISAVVDVKALEVNTLEELKNAVAEGGKIVLMSDLEDVDTITIENGKDVILDLNGHSITTGLQSAGRHYYAIDNYGSFTLDDSKGTGIINARGIENLGGTMVINGGTIVSVDANGGAAIWNEDNIEKIDSNYYFMPDKFDLDDEVDSAYYEYFNQSDTDNFALADLNDGYIYKQSGLQIKPDSDHIYLIYYKYRLISSAKLVINGGTFRANYVGSTKDSSGPGCLNNRGYAEIHAGNFISLNKRTYAIISTGEIKIDETKGDVVVSGTHGGLGIDFGQATINGGSYSSEEFYGIWITNNGNVSNVTINDGLFTGIYGLYSSVDDGKQDVGDVSIVLNGGEFRGTIKSAVAINSKNSENEWGMIIRGGIYNSDVSHYVDPDRSYVYTIGDHDSLKYVVITNVLVDASNKITDSKGEDIIQEHVVSKIKSILKGEEISGVTGEIASKIKEALAEGKTLTSKIVVDELDDNMNIDEKVLGKYKLGSVFDITLYIFANDEQIGNISELDEPIRITIPIPENLLNVDKGVNRVYKVYRIHDGKTEELETVVNDDGTVTFESDKYSTFILSYMDEQEVVNPNTVDNLILYVLSGLVSLILVIVSIKNLKAKYNI